MNRDQPENARDTKRIGDEAIKAACIEHWEHGRPVYWSKFGWIVEVKGIRKLNEQYISEGP